MKTLITILILTIFTFKDCFSQLVLTKKDKVISLDTNKIWGVQTNSILLSSVGNYEYDSRRKIYKNYLLFRLDSVKDIKQNIDTLNFEVRIIQYYIDTVTGKLYSNSQIDKEWKRGNYHNKSFTKDTTFKFAVNDIQQLQIQTRSYRHGDPLGELGLLLMGTAATIVSVVTILKGNANGYYGLALGLGLIELGKIAINKSRYIYNFKTTKNQWKIKTE